jgi:hypothetical protein
MKKTKTRKKSKAEKARINPIWKKIETLIIEHLESLPLSEAKARLAAASREVRKSKKKKKSAGRLRVRRSESVAISFSQN